MRDFFISYNSNDKDWATWIAGVLEENHYTTFIQVWDILPGHNFINKMDTATKECDRTIAVLSKNYIDAKFTHAEWQTAFREDPCSEERKLIPVRIDDFDIDGLLGSIVYIDLIGKEEEDAKKELLNGVSNSTIERKGGFPGRIEPNKSAIKTYSFPGKPLTNFAFNKENGLQTPYSIDKKVEMGDKYKSEKQKKQIKILSITASPDSLIMYEEEQSVLLNSFSQFIGDDLVFDMPDPINSTLTELDNYLDLYGYDILIISAHGSEDGKLMFEDENGDEVNVPAAQLAGKFEKHSKKPSIVILSACHSAKENINIGLQAPAQELFETGSIACVIGMQKSISQLAAIDFNKGFIQSLLNNNNIKEAFNNGKQAIKDGEEKRIQNKGDNWTYINEEAIPELFVKPNSESVIRANFHEERIKREKLISADFEGAKYVERGFIGRRNELRSIMKLVLSDKDSRIVVKGPGGVGKSALTTRICANLKSKAWELLIFVGVIQIDIVISKIFGLMENSGNNYVKEMLGNPEIPWQQKFRYTIKEFLAKNRVAIIFDNFEDNQVEETGVIKNKDLKEFITICNDLKNHASTLIITTRYKLPNLHNPIELKDFSPIETRKLVFQYKTLAKLTEKQITNIHKKIGANPRVLELLDSFSEQAFGNENIHTETLEELIDETVEKVTGDNRVEEDFAPWFIGRLISYLNKDEIELLKAISLYRHPVKSEGLFIDANKIRSAREKLERLSLTVYIPVNIYFAHRLTSNFVIKTLFKEDHLKEQRKKVGNYLEKVNPFEAIYQYKEAEESGRAFEIAHGLHIYLRDYGYVYEAREQLESFLKTELTEKNRGILCHSLGMIEQYQGNQEKALVYFHKSMEIHENLSDIDGKGKTICHIGQICLAKGDHEQALEYFNESIKIHEKLGDISSKGKTISNIGMIYFGKGDYEQALTCFNQSMEICEKLKDDRGESNTLMLVGTIYQYKRDYEKALIYFNQSMNIFNKLGDIGAESNAIHQIGMIYQDKGEYEQALNCFNKSMGVKQKLGDIIGISNIIHHMGMIHLDKGDFEQALKCFDVSMENYEKLGYLNQKSNTLNEIGMVYQVKGDYELALKFYIESMQINEKLEDINGKSKTLHNIGMINQYKQNYEQALKCYNDSINIKKTLEDITGVAITKEQIGILYFELKKYNEAFDFFIEAYTIFKKIQNPKRKIVAFQWILRIKKVLPEDYYKNGLQKAAIDEDKLIAVENENLLKKFTMMSLNEDENARKFLQTILDRCPEEVKENDEGEFNYTYIKHLHALAHAVNKRAFIKSSNDTMVNKMVELMGKKNVPGLEGDQ